MRTRWRALFSNPKARIKDSFRDANAERMRTHWWAGGGGGGINPAAENIDTENGLVLIIHVVEGLNKPYQDKSGIFWVKSGADKRKARSREEIQRLFQSSRLLFADEIIQNDISISELDIEYFSRFFENRHHKKISEIQLSLDKLIENLKLGKKGCLNLAGSLLFANNPSDKLPVFILTSESICSK
jgi:ATP-dependent DNA helicase RecG